MREWHHEFTETAAGIHWRLIEKSGGGVVAEGDVVSRDDAWAASIAALPVLAEGATMRQMHNASDCPASATDELGSSPEVSPSSRSGGVSGG